MKMVDVAVSEDMARYLAGAYYIVPVDIPEDMVERAAAEIAVHRGHVTGTYDSDREMARAALAAALGQGQPDA